LPGVGVVLSVSSGQWTGYPIPSYSYQWKRDGSNIGTNSPFYTAVLADVGALITCTVTAANGTLPNASANSSNSIGPIVALPSNDTAPVVSGTNLVGATVTVSTGAWTGAESYSYQWYQAGAIVIGATLDNFVLTTAGVTVHCIVTATNSGGSTPQASNTFGPVGLVPTNTLEPSISGTAAASQTLTRTTGSWLGYPASYSYATKWYADGVEISGQTGSTLALTAAMAGSVITCTVVATNSAGSSDPETSSNSLGPITSPPVAVAVAITGGSAVGDDLTLTTNTWYGYPLPTFSRKWYADDVEISGAIALSFTLTAAEEGDLVKCIVIASNIHGVVSETSNVVGPISGTVNEYQRVTESGQGRVTEDGNERVVEQYTTDVLTLNSITPIAGGQAATVNISTSVDAETLFGIVVEDGSPVPTAGQIEAGTDGADADAVWSDGIPLGTLDTYAPGITGLTQDTDYTFYAVIRRSATPGDYSNVVTGDFTSADALPLLTALTAGAKGPTSALLSVVTDDPGGAIKWGVFPSATVPTRAEILAGTNGAVAFGSKSVSGTGLYAVPSITGLSAVTAYKAHAYQIDAGAAEGDIVSSAAFTTKAAETVKFQAAHNGTTTGLAFSASMTTSTGQADPLGGNNAIHVSCNPGGVTTTVNITRTQSSPLWEAGINRFRFGIKKIAWASAFAGFRWRTANLSADALFQFDLDAGTFAAPNSRITNYTSISMGNGWWFVQFDADLFHAGADYNGSVQLSFASSIGNNAITTSGAHTIALFDYQGVY
jgi:hypothetical protein